MIRRIPSIYERYCEWDIERTFRTTKSLLETRPIYHKLDETIRGHVACSFLALVLKKELEDRLAAADNGARASWPAVMADLDSLTETEVEQDGKRFLLRSAPRPGASLALSALGVALPPTMRPVVGRLIYAIYCFVVPRPSRSAILSAPSKTWLGALSKISQNFIPFGSIAGFPEYQQVYAASDFSGTIQIDDIAFYVASAGTGTPNPGLITISLSTPQPPSMDLAPTFRRTSVRTVRRFIALSFLPAKTASSNSRSRPRSPKIRPTATC